MRILPAVLLLPLFFSGCMDCTIAAPFSLVQKMQGWQETGVVHQYVPTFPEFAVKAAFDNAGRFYCAYELPGGDGIQVKRLRSGRWEALSATTSPAPNCSNMQFVVTEGGTPFVACGSNNYIIIRRWDGNIWRDDTNFQYTGWKTLALGFDYSKNVQLAYKTAISDEIQVRNETNWGIFFSAYPSLIYSTIQLLSSSLYDTMIYATRPNGGAMLLASSNAFTDVSEDEDLTTTNGQALVDNYGKVLVTSLGGDEVARFRGIIPGSIPWMDETTLAIPNVNAFRMAQYCSGTSMFLGVRTYNNPDNTLDERITLYQDNPWRQYSDPAESPVVFGHALAVSPSGEVWMVAVVQRGDEPNYDLRAYRYWP